MKIIFSRKGFDSQYGGVASPIFSDDTMVSLPIPSAYGRPVGDINVSTGSMADLVSSLTRQRLGPQTLVHLDPDLRRGSVPRIAGWRPSFGQVSRAQRHLANQGVGIGDIFLFFGWFRRAERIGATWKYVPGAPNIHSMFGWLQVGDVMSLDSTPLSRLPPWLHDHPHAVFRKKMEPNNCLYIGAKTLFDGHTKGAGIFSRWSPQLQLTAPGRTRSVWRLPSWMAPGSELGSLSYHGGKGCWQTEGQFTYLKTVAKGQEFVIDIGNSDVARKWLSQLIQMA